jgi:hypothetical protein
MICIGRWVLDRTRTTKDGARVWWREERRQEKQRKRRGNGRVGVARRATAQIHGFAGADSESGKEPGKDVRHLNCVPAGLKVGTHSPESHPPCTAPM